MAHRRVQVFICCVALLFALSTVSAAQDKQPSKVDVFVGYAWLDPRGEIGGTTIKSIVPGAGSSVTYFFAPNAGATVDFGAHVEDNRKIYTAQVGPTFRFTNASGVVPFVHGFVGLHRLELDGVGEHNGIGLTAGGGIDLVTKWQHFNFRLIEADYQYGRHSFDFFNRVENNGIRLRTGLVFNFGGFGPPPAPPTAACTVQPTEVFAGEPVTLTAAGSNFNPKRTLTYNWTGTGVKIAGTGNSVQVDTNGMQPGSYPVRAMISDGKKGTAECTANVVIKQPQPPTISCAANPNVVEVGNTSSITATASSPDNRPLTYSYQASGGTVTGEGPSATLNTTGVQPGTVTVTCNVNDDRNLTASNTATVTVQAPPPPPPPPAAPEASKINSIQFKRMNSRVDNAAKAVLDDVALRLQRDADARAVIVGQQDATEKSRTLAAQRAINTKAYLVKEKGIDPARFDLRSGPGGQTADIWIVPAGATFNTEGTEAVSETKGRTR
jgi:outer membrane protein OmpA-like peptidoglycan-associated protein